jgi:tetratricopeptide (TPR) repeat protein
LPPRAGQNDGSDELRSVLGTAEPAPEESLVVGHHFGGWLEVHPDPRVLPVLENACLLEQSGASEDAIEILGEAIGDEDAVASADLLLARGALYCSAGFPRAASGDFQRATRLVPQRASAWFALGKSYAALSLSRQALEALERSASLRMDTTELHVELARRCARCTGAAARRASSSWRSRGTRRSRASSSSSPPCSPARPATSRAACARGTTSSNRTRSAPRASPSLQIVLQEAVGAPIENVIGLVRALDIDHGELERSTAHVLTALRARRPRDAPATAQRLLAGRSIPGGARSSRRGRRGSAGPEPSDPIDARVQRVASAWKAAALGSKSEPSSSPSSWTLRNPARAATRAPRAPCTPRTRPRGSRARRPGARG